MIRFNADFFDGKSARKVAVEITVHEGRARVQGDGVSSEFAAVEVQVSPRIGNTPYRLNFPDGASAVTPAVQAVEQAFLIGAKPTLAHRLESHLGFVMASLVALMIILFAGYRFGVPRAAESIALNLPLTMESTLAEESLKAMDGIVFRKSELPAERQQQVSRLFDELRTAAQIAPAVRLEFRHGGWIGANALALPGGVVVVTDQLVLLLRDDDELAAVLAHEIGHVDRRHSLRHVLQDSITGLVAVMIVGDVSSIAGLAATVPTVMMHAGYSRDFEREADAFTFDLLKKTGRSPRALGRALEQLEAAHREKKAGSPDAGSDGRRAELGYFSTHPATEERVRAAAEAAR